MKSTTRSRGIQSQEVMKVVARIHEVPTMDPMGKRRRQALTILDDEGYLLQLCRRTEWKEVGNILSFMLYLLRQNEQGQSSSSDLHTTPTTISSSFHKGGNRTHLGRLQNNDRREIVQKVRRQLLAHDSNGNNCLHLICYLKPASSRILPLLFQVARAADGVALSITRNDHASTALMVACSARFSRSLVHVLLQHGEVSLETIVACDRQGNTPFTGLIQCYRLLSKIPSFRNRYIDLETVNASCFSTKSPPGKLEPLDYTNDDGDEWDEEKRGSFPLLWDTCTNLMLTGWHSTYPGTFCPSILHGAALVATAMPPLLTDVVLQFYGRSHVDSSTLADLIHLVIKGTTFALQKTCHLAHYAMYQNRALHFVRTLLDFQPEQTELRGELPGFLDCFHEAIKVGLTWHLISSNDRGKGEVDQQQDKASSWLSWNGGHTFDGSRPWAPVNHPAPPHVISSPQSHDENPLGWLQALSSLCPDALKVRDPTFGLFPFQLAALPHKIVLDCKSDGQGKDLDLTLDRFQVDTIYNLLVVCPDVIKM